MKNKSILLFTLSAVAYLWSGCGKASIEELSPYTEGTAILHFDARVGDDDFALYTPFTIGGQTLEFEGFRYWVSNISLINDANRSYDVPWSYHLLEETSPVAVQDKVYPAKKVEDLYLSNIRGGAYKQIRFSIGVDAVHNDNLTLRDGELTALSGMAFESNRWFTSYIFTSISAKLIPSGNSALSDSVRIRTGTNAQYREVSIDLPENWIVSSNRNAELTLKVDVAQILEGLDFARPDSRTVNPAQPALMDRVTNNFSTKAISYVSSK